MTDRQNSNVEFFNSESSFGSSSMLSSSRVVDLAEELTDETESLFFTLRKVLVPREDILNQAELHHIIHRAKILGRETIPQNIGQMEKSRNSEGKVKQAQINQNRLFALVDHYEQYKKKEIQYEQFFNIYGRDEINGNFSKKQQNYEVNIQPDVVQIIEAYPSRALKGVARPTTPLATVRDSQKQKQLQELKDEILLLKKRERNLQREYEANETRSKMETEQRVRLILQMHKNSSESQIISTMKQQLIKNQNELQDQYQFNNISKMTIEKLKEQIKQAKLQNNSLREEIQSNRRELMNSSRISQAESEGARSVFTDIEGGSGNQIKRLQKIIRNLTNEKQLLKSELNKERNNFYKKKKFEMIEQENELSHLKKMLEKRNQELAEVKKQMDRFKVQGIQMHEENEQLSKELELAKFQLKAKSTSSSIKQSSYKSAANLAVPKQNIETHKYSVSSYHGNGDEGTPYYELLSRQFKIRCKRACLRQKQLLYKANGLEVGVITQYMHESAPSEIKVILHLSNFCDQQAIKSLKLKISNPMNNKINLEKSYYDLLDIGQQVKSPVEAMITKYPLGPTILICEYQYYGKSEEVRVILPVHIFKMLSIKPRDGEYREPLSSIINIERKIGRDFSAVSSYFRGATVTKQQNLNIIKSSIIHEPTETKLLLDLKQINNAGKYQLISEHRSGEEAISAYIVKTLSFLLSKDDQ